MFEQLLEKIALALDKAGIPYMIVGGQAVLLYGEPRLTRDIDITLGITLEKLEVVVGREKGRVKSMLYILMTISRTKRGDKLHGAQRPSEIVSREADISRGKQRAESLEHRVESMPMALTGFSDTEFCT